MGAEMGTGGADILSLAACVAHRNPSEVAIFSHTSRNDQSCSIVDCTIKLTYVRNSLPQGAARVGRRGRGPSRETRRDPIPVGSHVRKTILKLPEAVHGIGAPKAGCRTIHPLYGALKI